ncbi:MAG: hypothetical protein Kow0080_01130 [Candidatus Promineifilaceae bacterium]
MKKPAYRAYLLRIWQEGKDPTAWRMSLEEVGMQRQLMGFGGLPELVEYLHALTNESITKQDDDPGQISSSFFYKNEV